jgi:hypothetical protein
MARDNTEKKFDIAYQTASGKLLLLPCEPDKLKVGDTIVVGGNYKKLFYETTVNTTDASLLAIEDRFRHGKHRLDLTDKNKIDYRGEIYAKRWEPVSVAQPIVPLDKADGYGALMRSSNGFLYVSLDRTSGKVKGVWSGGRINMESRSFEIIEETSTGTTFRLGDNRLLKYSAGCIHTNRFDGWLDWCMPGERYDALHVPSRKIMQVIDTCVR